LPIFIGSVWKSSLKNLASGVPESAWMADIQAHFPWLERSLIFKAPLTTMAASDRLVHHSLQ
ncbi:MAG: hypothetical protein OSA84_03860, partial [Akkermansiaceae bacterium]|nr:hypothetical protein [Akkermansiaceae bacterium]